MKYLLTFIIRERSTRVDDGEVPCRTSQRYIKKPVAMWILRCDALWFH
jgi:hypothetical protein